MDKRTVGHGYYALRWTILERDGFTCQYCGQHAPNVRLEVDHIVPVADGGIDSEDNLITSCWACNQGKGALITMRKRARMIALEGKVVIVAKPPHPPRTGQDRIYNLLKTDGGLTITQIADNLGGSPDTIGVTLRRLKRRNMVTSRRKDKRLLWSIKTIITQGV